MQQEEKELREQKFDDNKSIFAFLKRLVVYSFTHKKWFWGFTLSIAVVGLIDGIYPLLWMYFIDYAIVPGVQDFVELSKTGSIDQMDYSNIYKYAGIFLFNIILSVIAVYIFVLCAGTIQEKVLFSLRQEMFEKLQRLSFSFYDTSQSGWLLSRITSDADKVCSLLAWGLLDLTYGLTVILACLISMAYFEWKLALIVGLSIPLLILLSIKIRLLILKYSRASRRVNSEIISKFTENINGIEVNKITAQEERVSQNFRELSERMRKVTYKASYFSAMYNPLVIFIGSLTGIIVIYMGGNLVVSAGLTIGTFAAFFRYATRIFDPILEISHFYAMAQSCMSAGERIFGLLDEETTIKDKPGVDDFERIKGAIEFKDLIFNYNPEKNVLDNFNLKVKPGQSIAIVGPTGEGKTTIVNLIARFYEPVEGQLLIDGIDYREKTLKSLRSQLGMVLQDPHLFAGSVRDNLRFAKPDASDDEIYKALEMVAAQHLFERLEEEVGEGGERLSIGERQLISFARAILSNPSILIMDEATSSIDTLAEAKIQEGIKNILKGRTSFIIAHRLSTIKNCDRILVIGKGKVVEDGSHKELMHKEGKYFDLYTRQIRKVESLEASIG